MMPAKMATLGLLQINVFWNKGYDGIFFANEVAKKNLSHDLNYIVNVLMWPKFGRCSISMREVMITSVLHQCGKRLKLKSRSFGG